MKKAFIISLFLLAAVSGQLWAKEKAKIALLPFSVHSAENIDYLQSGIGDMLYSRIAVDGSIEVINKETVLDALKERGEKELTLADVYGLGKKMNVDFVVWGSITKIGNSLSIDGKLVDVVAYKSPVGIFTQSQSMDEVIPKISDFAQRINYHILGASSSTSNLFPVTLPDPMPQQRPPQYTREAEIASGIKTNSKATFTSIINPDFINAAQPLDRKGFWMSRKYPTEFKGMDIGDVNKDGLNEVVVIDSHNVMIYQKKGGEFTLLHKISGKSYENYLSVDVADVNHTGVKQIFVTSLSGNTLNSFVLEFKGGRFVEVASNLRWFLRVIDSSSDNPLFLGQRMGTDKATFDTPIYEIVWIHGKYREGGKMKIPLGLSIYGLTMESLEVGGSRKVIALDSADHLCIYEETEKPLAKINVLGGSNELLWRSDDVFGGSNNYFENADANRPNRDDKYTYLNTRILTHDIIKDGKKEVVIVKNISSVGRIFKNLRDFTSSEISDLEWDGLGLVENWKTRKINGYVADYQFKDIDNDGQKEIVLALVLSKEGFGRGKSTIVAYKLNVQ